MASIKVGALRCTTVDSRGEREGMRYWRIWRNSKSLWNGWATEEQVVHEAGRLLTINAYSDNRTNPTTVGELCNRWISNYVQRIDVAASTKNNSQRAITTIIKHLGSVPLHKLNSPQAQSLIDTYRDTRLKAGASPSYIHLEYRRLKQAWLYGTNQRWCSGDIPPLTINHYYVSNRTTPSDEQILKLLNHLNNTWARKFLLVAYYTGARLSEVGTLTWAQVDFTTNTLTFLRKRSHKGRGQFTAPQVVPAPPQLLSSLLEWHNGASGSEPVLGVSYTTIRCSAQRHLVKACNELNIPAFTPHGLRRAAVRRFRRAGVPVSVASELLSHSASVMMKHYEEVTTDDLRLQLQQVYPVSGSVSASSAEPCESPGSAVPVSGWEEQGVSAWEGWERQIAAEFMPAAELPLRSAKGHPGVQQNALCGLQTSDINESVTESVSGGVDFIDFTLL